MKQWKRNCRLTVQVQKGQEDALDLSEMRITFRIGQATADNPKFAEIYIYNLSVNTMNRLAGSKGENGVGQTVILEAGYGSELDIIFKGQVFQYRRGRDNPTDTWFCILAQSGDIAMKYAMVNQPLAKGLSLQDQRDAIKAKFKEYGVDSGYMPPLSDTKLPRGKVLFGSASDLMNDLALTSNCEWVIEDNIFTMIAFNGFNQEPAFVMSPETGLIGMPQLTTDGLKVTCLLNPRLKWGGQIQVDMSHIQTQSFDIGYQDQYVDQMFKDLKTAADSEGFYNIKSVNHSGDTRGDEWYTELVCVGVDSKATPITGVAIKGVQ